MNVIRDTIKTFPPAYFAMVMATGIISIASNLLGFTVIAYGLFYLNVIAYAIILTLQVMRLCMYWDLVLNDISDSKQSLVFFTTVASTNVLGAQFITIANCPEIAMGFWLFGIFLWAIVSMSTFSILFIRCDERLETAMHGGWLIATVGTQSVAVLGAILAPKFVSYGSLLVFSSLVWWMIGSFLYIILITILFYRLVFFKMSPEALIPPYWINMGALAITTMAGSLLCVNIPQLGGAFSDLLTFTKGFTLFFWSFGTWWLPLLIILAIWKYGFNKVRFEYSPFYWSMVFPLGMYTACTIKLSQAIQIPFLINISKYFIYIAFATWCFIFVSMIISIIKSITKNRVAITSPGKRIVIKTGKEAMNVLIVDDDLDLLSLLKKRLENQGLGVLVAHNGREALEKLRNGNIRLVITDWTMPEMDGITLCRRIRASGNSGYVYIILLTVSGSKEDIVAGIDAGADDYLTKPFNPDELIMRIDSGFRVLRLDQSLLETTKKEEEFVQVLY